MIIERFLNKKILRVTALSSLLLFLVVLDGHFCQAYVPPDVQVRWKKEGYSLDQAIKTIERCAEEGEDSEDNELYYAVRYIDRNAHKLYKDRKVKEELYEKAKGSWELRLAYEEPHNMNFQPYPDFRDYAMVRTLFFSCSLSHTMGNDKLWL